MQRQRSVRNANVIKKLNLVGRIDIRLKVQQLCLSLQAPYLVIRTCMAGEKTLHCVHVYIWFIFSIVSTYLEV